MKGLGAWCYELRSHELNDLVEGDHRLKDRETEDLEIGWHEAEVLASDGYVAAGHVTGTPAVEGREVEVLVLKPDTALEDMVEDSCWYVLGVVGETATPMESLLEHLVDLSFWDLDGGGKRRLRL